MHFTTLSLYVHAASDCSKILAPCVQRRPSDKIQNHLKLQGGGALLIHPNTSSPKEQSAPGHEARGPSRAHNAANFSESFVQVALWGDGEFHPLLRATSTGLSFEGGPGRVEKGASNRKAISTEEGDLEISPAAGEEQRLYAFQWRYTHPSRIVTPSRKGCVVNGPMAKVGNK